MDKKFNELLMELHKILKPLGYRKEGANYRLFLSDGLCRIINLQKNRYNSKDKCEFVINIGVYFEKADVIEKRKFKEYDCQIRKRLDREEEEWWRLDSETEIGEILQDLEETLREIDEWFSLFPSKESVIRSILDGTAEQYSTCSVLHFYTAKMLAEMGFSAEVYQRIKDVKVRHPQATMLIELAEKLRVLRNSTSDLCDC